MKKAIIHIGAPKAGSTAIQEYCTHYAKQLREFGIFYPVELTAAEVSHFGQACIPMYYSGEKTKYNAKEICANPFVYLKNAILPSENLLISADIAVTMLDKDIRNFKKDLIEIGIESFSIVFYARRQDQATQALYQTDIIHGNCAANFSDWYKSKSAIFDYYQIALLWESVFELGSVTAIPYIKENFYRGDLLQDFIYFVFNQIGLEYKNNLLPSIAVSGNKKIPDWATIFTRIGNKSTQTKLIRDLSQQLLLFWNKDDRTAGYSLVKPSQQQGVFNDFRESNRLLGEKYCKPSNPSLFQIAPILDGDEEWQRKYGKLNDILNQLANLCCEQKSNTIVADEQRDVLKKIEKKSLKSIQAAHYSSKRMLNVFCLYVPDNVELSDPRLEMLRVAVHSCVYQTSLQPVVLLGNNIPLEMSQWLRDNGVLMIHHEISFAEQIRQRYSGAELNMALGAFLRCDIPLLFPNEDYVLYTDIDVVFKQDPAKFLNFDMDAFPVAMCREIAGRESGFFISDWMFNSGVTLFNIQWFRNNSIDFCAFANSKNWQFKADNLDQGLLNDLFSDKICPLPSEFNWRPYQGDNPNQIIRHYHAYKPYGWDEMVSDYKFRNQYITDENVKSALRNYGKTIKASVDEFRKMALFCDIEIKIAVDQEVEIHLSQFYDERFNPEFVFTNMKKGTWFVQVGANDGVLADPIHHHVEKGIWSGLLIEPLPDYFAALKQSYLTARGKLSFLQCVIAEEGLVTMYRVKQEYIESYGGWAKGVSSLGGGVIKQIQAYNPDALEAVEVEGLTFDLATEKASIFQFELLVIDTEGYDWRVLKQVDLDRYNVNVIFIEVQHLSNLEIAEMVAMFNKSGWLWKRIGEDVLAVRRSFWIDLIFSSN